jgi:glutamate-1-semialdehyde 2,1-aminomutase
MRDWLVSLALPEGAEPDVSFDQRYEAWAPRSGELIEAARRHVPGGASSSARTATAGWRPYPPFIASGSGSRLRDVDGNQYIDYLLGLGPLILGHRHPRVTAAVTQAINGYGTCFALPYELETIAARKVVDAVPGVDMVRFSNSGSEAVGSAIRLARAYTGRRLVIRFEGHYNGWQDTVFWSTKADPRAAGPASRPRPVPSGPGLPRELADTLIVLTWNDPASLRQVMAERGVEVAAVITEPVMLNAGCVLPEPGYLELLRELTTAHGALLIFDEVITGFRLARGGAQEYFGVLPDLTVLAKGLGGGFPAAAVGGSLQVMSMIADGRYAHSGTYNGNVVACAAVSATMDVLAEPGLFDRQRELGHSLAAELRLLAAAAGVPVTVASLGTVMQVRFGDHPISNWRDARNYADEGAFTRWWQEMLLRGVMIHPDQHECMFVSLVHDRADVDRTLEAAVHAFAAVAPLTR